jgi:hypothetical protein
MFTQYMCRVTPLEHFDSKERTAPFVSLLVISCFRCSLRVRQIFLSQYWLPCFVAPCGVVGGYERLTGTPLPHFYLRRFETVFIQQSQFVLIAESVFFFTETFVATYQTSRRHMPLDSNMPSHVLPQADSANWPIFKIDTDLPTATRQGQFASRTLPLPEFFQPIFLPGRRNRSVCLSV